MWPYYIFYTNSCRGTFQIVDPLWYQVNIYFSARVVSDIRTTYYTNSCRSTFYVSTSSTVDIDRLKFTSSLKLNGSGWTYLSILHVAWDYHRSSNTVASTVEVGDTSNRTTNEQLDRLRFNQWNTIIPRRRRQLPSPAFKHSFDLTTLLSPPINNFNRTNTSYNRHCPTSRRRYTAV